MGTTVGTSNAGSGSSNASSGGSSNSGASTDLLNISTPLPPGSFDITSLSGSEQLSSPFKYIATLTSASSGINPNQLLDQPVTVSIGNPSTSGRYISGVVSAVKQTPAPGATSTNSAASSTSSNTSSATSNTSLTNAVATSTNISTSSTNSSNTSTGLWTYTITIVPPLALLGQTLYSRFYTDMSIPAIVESILNEFGITYSDQTTATYPTQSYTVQYNESYLDFINRMLQSAGIYYYFTSDPVTGSTMVLADSSATAPSASTPTMSMPSSTPQGPSSYTYQSASASTAQALAATSSSSSSSFTSQIETYFLSGFESLAETALGYFGLSDYNPATTTLAAGTQPVTGSETTTSQASGAASRISMIWPGLQSSNAGASTASTIGMLAEEAASYLFSGSGSATGLSAGSSFSITNDLYGIYDYIVQEVEYYIGDASTGASTNSTSSVSTVFTAYPASTTWRDKQTVSAPVMAGVYSAIVIGPAGEEIFMDDLGRIQLSFPWDYKNEIVAGSTYWARVMQPWAGSGWGTQFIPRVGMEVAVVFQEGDVNRPFVLGSMYNVQNMPPWDPAKKNISGIRTRSTPGGWDCDYNEIFFNDTTDHELLNIHAQKNYSLSVENNQYVTIAGTRYVDVGDDEYVYVAYDQSISIGCEHTLNVGYFQTIYVGFDQSISIGCDQWIDVGNDQSLYIGGSRYLNVSYDDEQTIGCRQLIYVDDSQSLSVRIDQDITLELGDQKTKLWLGNQTIEVCEGSITTSAGDSITLAVGCNSFVMNSSGITLTVGSSNVTLASSGISMTSPNVTITGDASATLTAPSTTVDGSASLDLKGASVLIG